MCEREKERVGRAFPSCSVDSGHGALLKNKTLCWCPFRHSFSDSGTQGLRDSDPEMLLRQQHRVVISSSPTILMASKQLLKSTPLTLPLRLNLSSPITISAFPLKSTSRIFPVSLKTSASPYTSHSNVPRPGLSSLFIYMYVRARLVLFFGIAYEH